MLFTASAVSGQTPAPPAGQPPASPGFRKPTGDDERRAKQLDEQIDKALKADRWDEAIAKAEELLALQTRIQGPKHCRGGRTRSGVSRHCDGSRRCRKRIEAADVSADGMNAQGETLYAQGKYAATTTPLYEQARWRSAAGCSPIYTP